MSDKDYKNDNDIMDQEAFALLDDILDKKGDAHAKDQNQIHASGSMGLSAFDREETRPYKGDMIRTAYPILTIDSVFKADGIEEIPLHIGADYTFPKPSEHIMIDKVKVPVYQGILLNQDKADLDEKITIIYKAYMKR